MDYATLFFISYFGIYVVMGALRGIHTVVGFFFRDILVRLLISAFVVYVYTVFEELPAQPVEVSAEPDAVPGLDISDIMIDDMKDHEITMEPAFILGVE